jgi:hypothetical protein
MRLKSTVAVLALAGLSLASCHSNSPTSTSSFNVVITIGIANSTLQPTIMEAQLVYDGTVITDTASPAPTPFVSLGASGPTTPGAHTMAVLLVSQTSTPNNYTVTTPDIKEYDANNNLIKDIPLPTMSATLATGQAITYNITL